MAKSLKPRPTEYKGIVYKSKSEAMFARWLELVCEESASIEVFNSQQSDTAQNTLGPPSWGIVYEPVNLIVNDWGPDFLMWETTAWMLDLSAKHGGLQLPHVQCTAIEYKPARPTKTYLKTFLQNSIELLALIESREGPMAYRTRCMLYYGSVWQSNRGIFELCYDELSHEETDWLADFENAVKETRFDLEASR